MNRRKNLDTGPMECSFCGKAQFVVRKLICNASDFSRRVYICDECVLICNSILEDGSGSSAVDPVNIDSQERHPALDNPETSRFLRFVERWIRLESSGADSAAAFAEVRGIALSLFGSKAGHP
jgi:hypothetical protein